MLVCATLALGGLNHLEGCTNKGDALIVQARLAEAKDTTTDLDLTLKLAQEAFETDRLDIGYQIKVNRIRAFAAQYHVYDGQVFRDAGKLKQAVVEFQRAVELDPSSMVAPQELQITKSMLEEIRRNPSVDLDELWRRPMARKSLQDAARFANAAPVASLKLDLEKPLPAIKVNNQVASEVFLAIGRDAKIRVLFDPDYQNLSLGLNQQLDFHGLSLDQALDYLALITKFVLEAAIEESARKPGV